MNALKRRWRARPRPKLFATLETSTRRWHLPNLGQPFLIFAVDATTVGFRPVNLPPLPPCREFSNQTLEEKPAKPIC